LQNGTLEDRIAIRELIETFAVGVMRHDLEIWMGVWAEEGSWNLPSLAAPVKGRAALREAFGTKTGYFGFMSMLMFPHGLVFDGDRASGRAHGQEVILPHDGGMKFLTGCFDDEYVKRDGRWWFLSRNFNVIGIKNFVLQEAS
jgi:hypothetical protein